MRGAKRTTKRVRGYTALEERRHDLAVERQHAVARLPFAKHALVLRPRRVRRSRHQAHAQRRQDQVQADPYRQAAQLSHHRHCHFLAHHVRYLYYRFRYLGVVSWL